jgi:hypothetical protein
MLLAVNADKNLINEDGASVAMMLYPGGSN